MPYLSDANARQLVCDIGKKMAQKQMVAANDGNITVRVGDNEVIATPTGVNKGEMTPEMLLRVDMDGAVVEGCMKATSELPMHLSVYKVNPRIQSTCHSHALFLSAFAIAGIGLDLPISPETTMVCGAVPVAPYAMPGTTMLADSIKSYVNDYSIVNLSNHGPLSWGEKPESAWFVMEAAEAFAKECVLLKYVIQAIRPISTSQIESLADNLGVSLNPLRRTSTPAATDNTEPFRPLSSLTPTAPALSDADIERIADRVAAKLSGRP